MKMCSWEYSVRLAQSADDVCSPFAQSFYRSLEISMLCTHVCLCGMCVYACGVVRACLHACVHACVWLCACVVCVVAVMCIVSEH